MMETILRLFARRERIAAALAGAVGSAAFIVLLWLFFILLAVPDAERFLKLVAVFSGVGAIEGAIAGLAAHQVFLLIRDRRSISSLRK